MEQRIQFELRDYFHLEMLGLIKSPPGRECCFHTHPFWELIYSVSGESYHNIGGRTILLPQGELCLVPPNTEHSSENAGMQDNVKLYIGFSFFTSFPRRESGQTVGVGMSLPCRVLDYDLPALAESLDKRAKTAEAFQMDNLMGALSRLAARLPNDSPEQLNPRHLRQQTITGKVIDYLNQNINRSVRIDELASMFYLSPYYISEQFRQNTGVGIKQYHENLRMFHALQLLKEGKYTVTETAEKLGYENIHYFSRRFKDHFGYPPSQIPKTTEFVQTHF